MSQVDPRIETFNSEAEKVFHYLQSEFAKLQTGKASPLMVEGVMIEAYGQNQALKAVAGVSVQDGNTIVVQPWDKSVMGAVETALAKADLGAMPVNDGSVVRLTLPPMTEERRKDLTKLVHQLSEEARISIRQQRQHAHDDIKKNETDEDVRYTLLEELEKAVHAANDKIEELKKAKDAEVMTV